MGRVLVILLIDEASNIVWELIMAMRICKRLTVRGQKVASLECKHTDSVAICLIRAPTK